jgi:hypothetical protein
MLQLHLLPAGARLVRDYMAGTTSCGRTSRITLQCQHIHSAIAGILLWTNAFFFKHMLAVCL